MRQSRLDYAYESGSGDGSGSVSIEGEWKDEGDGEHSEDSVAMDADADVRVKQHHGGMVPRGTPGITLLPWVGVSHKLVNPWVGASHNQVVVGGGAPLLGTWGLVHHMCGLVLQLFSQETRHHNHPTLNLTKT